MNAPVTYDIGARVKVCADTVTNSTAFRHYTDAVGTVVDFYTGPGAISGVQQVFVKWDAWKDVPPDRWYSLLLVPAGPQRSYPAQTKPDIVVVKEASDNFPGLTTWTDKHHNLHLQLHGVTLSLAPDGRWTWEDSTGG